MEKFALLFLVLSVINTACSTEISSTHSSQRSQIHQGNVHSSEQTVTFETVPFEFVLPDSIKAVCKENADHEKEEIGCPKIDIQLASVEPKWIEQSLNFQITRDNSPNFTNFRQELQEFTQTQEGALPYYRNYKPKFVGMHNRVAQFSVLYSEFQGGAHGLYGKWYHQYDLDLGKELELSDVLLSGTDDLYELGKASYLNVLVKDKEMTPKEALEHAKHWTFEVSEEFYFDDRGLVLFYNIYHIAPYAMGFMEIPISYDKLDGILRPEYLPK